MHIQYRDVDTYTQYRHAHTRTIQTCTHTHNTDMHTHINKMTERGAVMDECDRSFHHQCGIAWQQLGWKRETVLVCVLMSRWGNGGRVWMTAALLSLDCCRVKVSETDPSHVTHTHKHPHTKTPKHTLIPHPQTFVLSLWDTSPHP